MSEPFDRLVSIMARLRSDAGCPWDREQTVESLKPYLIEESYEVLDAIDQGDAAAIRDELGDLLLQIVFHSQLRSERGEFTINDVIESINRKLVGRHPHIFGSTTVENSDDVVRNWELIKKTERRSSPNQYSVLGGVPRDLPGLLKAQRVQEKVSRVGFDWNSFDGARDKVDEELTELDQAIAEEDRPQMFEEFGDFLFACVNLARLLHIDAEEAMRAAVRKFTRRFQSLEDKARQAGSALESMTLEDMDVIWDAVKREEHTT